MRSGKYYLLIVVSVLTSLIVVEVLIGYYFFNRVFWGKSATHHLIQTLVASKFHQKMNDLSGESVKQNYVPNVSNPFISYPQSLGPMVNAAYRFHPFFDYTGVHGKDSVKINLDYFGFRNDNSNIYFDPKPDNDFLIIMTGGSESAGFSHETPIIKCLEQTLKGRPELAGKTVRILNLSMNSYVVANEINAFVHLGYHLKPAVVISHSGWNDMMYGSLAIEPFRRLGLNYYKPILDWLPRLYKLSTDTISDAWSSSSSDETFSIPLAYLAVLEKYRAIVESSGAFFIAGIQAYNKECPVDDFHRKAHELETELDQCIKGRTEYLNFIGNQSITFIDTIHTTNASAQLIADIYADRILQAVKKGKIHL